MSNVKIQSSNYFRILIFISGFCLIFLLFNSSTVRGEEPPVTRFISQGEEGALSITSRKMTLKNQEKTILFEGDVVLERDSMRLKARRVEAVFTSLPEGEQGLFESADKKRELSSITATGDVEFIQGSRTVLSNKVIYFKKDERMVFTGSPNIREGKDELKGEKITVHILEDRVVVEGGEAIIHPR